MSFICKICIKQNISAVFDSEQKFVLHMKNKHNINVNKEDVIIIGDE